MYWPAVVLSASPTYYQVPIKSDRTPMPTSLYVKVNVDPIGLPYKEFKAKKSTGSDKLFIDTMETLLKGSVLSAKNLIRLRSGLQTDAEIEAYLNRYRKLYNGVSNITVISKVYYSNGFAYMWSADLNGHPTANSSVFELGKNKVGKYVDLDSVSLVNKVIKDAVVKSHYLPDIYKQSSKVNLDFEVELEDKAGTKLGAFLSLNAVKANLEMSDIDSDVYKNNKLAQFYSKFNSALKNADIPAVFSKLSSRSKKRLGGIPASDKEVEVLNFISNHLVPETIVQVIEIAPFKVVVGTNFKDQYLEANTASKSERMRELSKVTYSYSYIVEKGADFQFVNVRRYGLLDQIFLENDFFSKKLVPQILSKQ